MVMTGVIQDFQLAHDRQSRHRVVVVDRFGDHAGQY